MRASIVVLVLIVLIVSAGAGFFLTNPQRGEEMLQSLGLAAPEPENYFAPGVLEAERLNLASTTGGRVLAVLAEEGQGVDAGQVLVRLDPALLEAQKAVLDARHEGALAGLRLLQNGPRPEDLAVARAAVAQAQAAVTAAETGLLDARSSTPISLRDERIDLAQAQVDTARAELAKAQAALDRALRGPSQEEIQRAQAAVEASLAQVAQNEQQLADLNLAAPRQGTVLERLVEPGELAQPGWPVVTLADLDSLKLVVYLPEAELDWVSLGDVIWLRLESQPARLIPGEVVEISDQAEFTPRNVQTPSERLILVYAVTIRISNLDHALKPGMHAEALFRRLP